MSRERLTFSVRVLSVAFLCRPKTQERKFLRISTINELYITDAESSMLSVRMNICEAHDDSLHAQ